MLTIKIVKIKDLPQGDYFRGKLVQLAESAETEVAVVAKTGHADDWAAYIGFPALAELKMEYQGSDNFQYYCERVHDPRDVAERGDKLSKASAITLFPELKKLRYRE